MGTATRLCCWLVASACGNASTTPDAPLAAPDAAPQPVVLRYAGAAAAALGGWVFDAQHMPLRTVAFVEAGLRREAQVEVPAGGAITVWARYEATPTQHVWWTYLAATPGETYDLWQPLPATTATVSFPSATGAPDGYNVHAACASVAPVATAGALPQAELALAGCEAQTEVVVIAKHGDVEGAALAQSQVPLATTMRLTAGWAPQAERNYHVKLTGDVTLVSWRSQRGGLTRQGTAASTIEGGQRSGTWTALWPAMGAQSGTLELAWERAGGAGLVVRMPDEGPAVFEVPPGLEVPLATAPGYNAASRELRWQPHGTGTPTYVRATLTASTAAATWTHHIVASPTADAALALPAAPLGELAWVATSDVAATVELGRFEGMASRQRQFVFSVPRQYDAAGLRSVARALPR